MGRVVGLHATGLDVEVVRFHNPDGIRIGNFATVMSVPPDEDIPGLQPDLKAAFILFIAGGVAGNKFCGVTVIDSGADADRQSLARFTDMTLEDLSDQAVDIINSHRRAFRQLVSLIRRRYMELTSNRNLATGRHTLVTQQDLDRLFSEYEKGNTSRRGQ